MIRVGIGKFVAILHVMLDEFAEQDDIKTNCASTNLNGINGSLINQRRSQFMLTQYKSNDRKCSIRPSLNRALKGNHLNRCLTCFKIFAHDKI